MRTKKIKRNLAAYRREYAGAQLEIQSVNPDPILQFDGWYAETVLAKIMDNNAMALATASSTGCPSVRIVLLKEYNSEGFIFYSNYQSSKGQQLEENPQAALNFYWQKLNRQVRIEGSVHKVSDEMSDAYFHSRPFESQLAAIASPQSQPIAGEALTERYKTLEAEFKNEIPQRPQHWGGYIVIPQRIEFWQGRPNRMHDRILYIKDGNEWEIERLGP